MSDSEYSDAAAPAASARPNVRAVFDEISDDESDGSSPPISRRRGQDLSRKRRSPSEDSSQAPIRSPRASMEQEKGTEGGRTLKTHGKRSREDDEALDSRNGSSRVDAHRLAPISGDSDYEFEDGDAGFNAVKNDSERSGGKVRRRDRNLDTIDIDDVEADGNANGFIRNTTSRRSSRDSAARSIDMDSDGEISHIRPMSAVRRSAATTGPTLRRTIPMQSRTNQPLTILKMPPTIDVPLEPCNPEFDELPPGGGVPILHRLKPGLSREDVADALLKHGPSLAMPHFSESNARLVTWSDGSRTLMIGDEHFAIAADRVTPSSLYIFRQSNDLQTFYGKAEDTYTVQPSTVNQKRSMLAMSPVNMKAKKPVRKMERMYDAVTEKDEKVVLASYHARQREEARLQSKRRRMAERQVLPERRMTKADLESDDEGNDLEDEREAAREERRREIEREARLRESQRLQYKSNRTVTPHRRKIAGRRVIDTADEDDDDDLDE